MVDPGEGPPPPPLFLGQTEAWRAQKNFFETRPRYRRVWMIAPHPFSPPPPPPHLKVWICHRSITNPVKINPSTPLLGQTKQYFSWGLIPPGHLGKTKCNLPGMFLHRDKPKWNVCIKYYIGGRQVVSSLLHPYWPFPSCIGGVW